MVLGIIFGETSTQEFSFLFGDVDGERQNQLKFSYVEVNIPESNDKVVAKVIDVNTENPLLAKDTAKFYSEHETVGISVPDIISHRFTLYQAKCEVMGIYNSIENKIEPLTQAIKPGEKVELLSNDVLNQLFSASEEWHFPLGYVEIPGRQTHAQVSLKADSIITMHACVFGMTGMGKTTTSAVLLEELMFRGAKIIVFDPHADYIHINRIRQKLNDDFSERIHKHQGLIDKISEYKELLISKWSSNWSQREVKPWDDFDPSFKDLINEKVNEELTSENIFYRLLSLCSIKNRNLMVDSTRISEQLDDIIDGITHLDLHNGIPQELIHRKLTIKFNAFPSLQVYTDKSPYFTMRLIEAIAGEGFSEAQEGFVIDWLSHPPKPNLSDEQLLYYLKSRIKDMPKSKDGKPNPSQVPLNRIVDKASRTVVSLIKRKCTSLNISNFVDAFCAKGESLSNVATAVFDLSDLENDHARRALIYAVMEFAFDRYKSKSFIVEKDNHHVGKDAHPVLFALEEARTLIPRQDESSTTGEMHPATRAARLAARQIATEGRKMGLGMLVISQKPASVDPITVSQANTLILHRVINPDDQTYIRNVGESLASEDLETLKTVKEGVAIVTGDALKTRMSTLVKVRNRYSEPGTEKPRPIERFWNDPNRETSSEVPESTTE